MADDRTPERILERLTHLYPKAIDLSLGRTERLLAAVGDPQLRLPPVVHVAGTNGKGSTVAYLRAIAEAAGLRANVYTSPHLVRFNERIRLAGRLIDDDALSAVLERVERANAGAPITLFEVTTVAAFLAFAETPADILVLETGLGGRLDATNVVPRPAATAITPISIDHVEFLGDTIAKIAFEKAGILKPGVPGVVAPQPADAAAVLDARAAEVGAPLFRAGREWRFAETEEGFRYEGRRTLDLPRPALPGAHQLENAAVAVAVAEQLPQFGFTAEVIAAGLRGVDWPARLQRLTSGPLPAMVGAGSVLFLDGGHNESGGAVIAGWAAGDPRPLDAVVAMKANKAADRFLANLAPHVRRLRAVSFADEPNWMPAERLTALAKGVGIADAAPAADATSALAELTASAGEPTRFLLCGSLYFAGKILEKNG